MRSFVFTLFGLVAILIAAGCASSGKLRLENGTGDGVTLRSLEKNWKDYVIYYAGQNRGLPSAVMFDRKDDDRTLTGDRWFKVDNDETLRDLLDWIQRPSVAAYDPRLWKILGSDDHLYGYMFTGRFPVLMTMIDEKTMYVFDPFMPHDLRWKGW
jgi:hypothetical protein